MQEKVVNDPETTSARAMLPTLVHQIIVSHMTNFLQLSIILGNKSVRFMALMNEWYCMRLNEKVCTVQIYLGGFFQQYL